MFSAYIQEVNLKIFIIFNLFYLRFSFEPGVSIGYSSFRICGVVPCRGGVRIISLHTIILQHFTNNFTLHTTRYSHTTPS